MVIFSLLFSSFLIILFKTIKDEEKQLIQKFLTSAHNSFDTLAHRKKALKNTIRHETESNAFKERKRGWEETKIKF